MTKPSLVAEARDELQSFIATATMTETDEYDEVASLLYEQYDIPGALATVIRAHGVASRTYDDNEMHTLHAKVERTKLSGIVAARTSVEPSVVVRSRRLIFPTFVRPHLQAERSLVAHRTAMFMTTLGANHEFDGFSDETHGARIASVYSSAYHQWVFDTVNRGPEEVVDKGKALAQLLPNGGESGPVAADFKDVVVGLSQLVLKATA